MHRSKVWSIVAGCNGAYLARGRGLCLKNMNSHGCLSSGQIPLLSSVAYSPPMYVLVRTGFKSFQRQISVAVLVVYLIMVNHWLACQWLREQNVRNEYRGLVLIAKLVKMSCKPWKACLHYQNLLYFSIVRHWFALISCTYMCIDCLHGLVHRNWPQLVYTDGWMAEHYHGHTGIAHNQIINYG